MKQRYVSVFAGSRDHYQVPYALAESDQLETLVTDFYLPDGAAASLPRQSRLLAKLRLANRHCAGLPSRLVTNAWPAFGYDLLTRFNRSPRLVARKDAHLGRLAGKLAEKRGAALLSYSYYASYAFERAAPGTRKVIFQVHPHPGPIRKIYKDELQLFPKGRRSILDEAEVSYPKDVIARLEGEALAADFVITPSTFAKQTLIDVGVVPERIAVVPYGISTQRFPAKQRWDTAKPLRLIFVGSMIQRKGLGYLFEAMRALKDQPVELVLVGRGACDEELLGHYADVPFRKVVRATHDQLIQELTDADVFVLPSLAESFALVIIEAMAVGLPVITTTHTAGPDIISEGVNGFVGRIRDVDFLVQKIKWFLAHREAVPTMGRAAQGEAGKRDWAGFRRGIRAAVADFEQR